MAGFGVGALGSPGAASAAETSGLRSALAVEQLVVFCYRHIVAAGTLGPPARRLAETMLAQDQTHVRVLRRLGQTAPPPPATVAAADRQLSRLNASGRLAQVRTEDDALRLLYDVESLAIGTYFEALHELADASTTRTVAEIMAADAQHASAIGGLLHPGKWARVVPVGSVEGKHQGL
jgi:rubrerythrin